MELQKFFGKLKKLVTLIIVCLALASLIACVEEERVPGNTIATQDEEFTVLPLQTMTVVVTMEAEQILIGNVTVKGGNDDIKVYVRDDFGEEVANFGTVTGIRRFNFKVPKKGYYTIYFDNSFSIVVNKEIKLRYSVR